MVFALAVDDPARAMLLLCYFPMTIRLP